MARQIEAPERISEMKTTPETAVRQTETATGLGKTLLGHFLDNMLDRVDGEIGTLTDRMADESNPEAILSLQKNLKRMRRRWSVLHSIADGIRPLQVQDLLNGIAEPEVREELQPMFDMIEDLQDAIYDTEEARHE